MHICYLTKEHITLWFYCYFFSREDLWGNQINLTPYIVGYKMKT